MIIIIPGGGGGGSGTVTNTGGALTANALVLGAGGNDTKVSTTLITDGTHTITVGGVGAGSGIISLAGNTSGNATITAPAVAGTFANPVAFANAISFPSTASSQPMLCNATNPTDGYGITGTRVGCFIRNGTCVAAYDNTLFRFTASGNHVLAWSNGDASSTAGYLGLSPLSAGAGNNILAVGTGAATNAGGLIQSGMTVFVTSNFTTSGVGTALEAITGLSITVPAVAANWKFHAHLSYSQAVGAAAVAFGIQAVTNNPTNIFAQATQQITTGPPATIVTGTLATLATTTATNIVSGTPGAQATNYVCDIYGTAELGASANTIRLLVSTGTAADLVTVLRGSYFSFCP